ncbi:hypothetical protein MtrunA17_Chr4g0042221 [Medicago truncatula]|uniref:Uncharacterized protein n=1 Tax=Medicago truncatula TaxID=3880 RepID=A0A396IE04_MEDTR|nr:hypothetical protein MtrunA17_Chr4g0042221 [Medicago truncatula]
MSQVGWAVSEKARPTSQGISCFGDSRSCRFWISCFAISGSNLRYSGYQTT